MDIEDEMTMEETIVDPSTLVHSAGLGEEMELEGKY